MAQNGRLVPSGQALKQVRTVLQSCQCIQGISCLNTDGCYSQAAAWLGVSDPVKLLDEDPAAVAFLPRPEGLGLGAKFLPHHKVLLPPFRLCMIPYYHSCRSVRLAVQAAHLTVPLEKRFGKRLQRSSTADAESDVSKHAYKRGRPMGKYQGMPV